MAGAFHKLDNVVAIVDNNRIQLDGFVKDIMAEDPLPDKWRAFGWHTIELDGHDFARHPQRAGGGGVHQGKAHLPDCPHHQGQRRLLHGEQP